MADTFDYLDWRGDLTFAQAPFCGVDALIFSELSYLDFTDIVPSVHNGGSVTVAEAAELYFAKHPEKDVKIGAVVPARIVELFKRAAKCPRFAGIGLSGFVNVTDDAAEEQFAALCEQIDEHTMFVAYRGTDDTIVGWRENFNMTFKAPVPAQLHAADYLDDVGSGFGGKLIIGGHSKGGNLAIWAASHCAQSLYGRITAVYNLDGPGFTVDFRETDGYLAIKSKIRTIVPECSVIGMFMDHEERYLIVKSSRRSLMQHDGLSWCVKGNHFERVGNLAPEIKRINAVLAAWIDDMDNEQREKFTDGFFGMLFSTNAETLTDLISDKKTLFKAITSADSETRQALLGALKLLLGESGKSVTRWLKKAPKKDKKQE